MLNFIKKYLNAKPFPKKHEVYIYKKQNFTKENITDILSAIKL